MIVGVGVDVVEIPRLRKILARYGERFAQRVFTPEEREYCAAHTDPAPHYAVRFAAKEALFKALGTGWARGVTWQDVEVRRKAPGAQNSCPSPRSGDPFPSVLQGSRASLRQEGG